MVINLGENIGFTLQLIKSDGKTVEEAATVTYRIFDDTGTLELVSEQTATYNTTTKSYVDSLVPSVSWTDQEVGSYLIVWSVSNTDDDFNDTYTEDLQVSIDKTKVDKILALVHENIVIDETEYDSYGNLSSARVRLFYDSNKTNILNTYKITSNSNAAGQFSTWEQMEV